MQSPTAWSKSFISRLTKRASFLFIMLYSSSTMAWINWQSETDAGLVVNQGNTETQAVSLKTIYKYKLLEKNTFTFRAEYFQSKGMVNGVSELTSENSLIELKYERLFNEMFGTYLVTSWAKDNFRGFENRYEIGPGLSYHFVKSENKNVFTEHGYIYRREVAHIPGPLSGPTNTVNFYRAYFEANSKFNPSLSGKFWTETKVNMENSEDVEIRVEPSLSILLTGNFSLGLAYRYSFDNLPPTAGLKRVDTMYMTTIKAKF